MQTLLAQTPRKTTMGDETKIDWNLNLNRSITHKSIPSIAKLNSILTDICQKYTISTREGNSKVSAWFPQNIILKILPLQLAWDQTSAKSPHSSATNLTSFDQSLFKRSCPHLFPQQMYYKWRNISFITSWNQKREFECMRLWGEVQGSRSMSFWDVQTFMFSSAQE